jgi:hypothetical protein
VSDVMMAFPANVIPDLLPPRDTLPEAYEDPWHPTDKRAKEYIEIVEARFFHGLPATIEFHMKPGIISPQRDG